MGGCCSKKKKSRQSEQYTQCDPPSSAQSAKAKPPQGTYYSTSSVVRRRSVPICDEDPRPMSTGCCNSDEVMMSECPCSRCTNQRIKEHRASQAACCSRGAPRGCPPQDAAARAAQRRQCEEIKQLCRMASMYCKEERKKDDEDDDCN